MSECSSGVGNCGVLSEFTSSVGNGPGVSDHECTSSKGNCGVVDGHKQETRVCVGWERCLKSADSVMTHDQAAIGQTAEQDTYKYPCTISGDCIRGNPTCNDLI